MPLIKPAPAIVRQTMQTAFQNLEKAISPNDSRDFHKSTLLSVRDEALDIETRLAARQSLRNMRRLMPLFTALEHYSKVVDVLCNGTPFLPWVWAPITLILRIASDHVEAFEQLVKGYSRIAESLQRFEILAHAFDSETQFQQTLAVFYADILEFHKHAYKFVRRNGWQILFLTSWGRFQRHFDSILDDMKRHEDLIDHEANARNIAEARAMRQELQAWKEERLEKDRLEDERQSAKEYRTLLSWLNIDESDQATIFESVSSQGNRHPGTCMWVTKNVQIRAWLQERPNTPILWLSGTAGSGKSVISTQLVNFTNNAKRTVFYHFCTHASTASSEENGYSHRQKRMLITWFRTGVPSVFAGANIRFPSEYDQLLKSLLAQALRQDAEWTAHVYNDLVLKRRTATIAGLEDRLRTILTCSSATPNEYLWVVLDGVDQLRVDSQSRLLTLMKQISGKASTTSGVCCKILISSRPSPTILRVLGKKPRISLTDQKEPLTKAIEEYSRQRLGLLDERFRQLGIESHELDKIGRQVADKADGMFLYARLVLDYISSNIFIHREALRLSINKLPKELSEFYHKILAQILAPLDPDSVHHIKCVLGWLAFSRRPLKKHELLSAVSFSSGNPDIRLPAPEYILSVCGALVEERSDATFSFIHVSVKDYLQESSSNLIVHEEDALQQQCLATVTCLFSSFRLLDDPSDNKYQLIVKGVYDFQVYACEYWTDYLLCVAESGRGLEAESRLLSVLNWFSERLRLTFQYHSQPVDPPGGDMETRMKHLQHHPEMAEHVKRAIQARSLDQLERNLKHGTDIPEETVPATEVEGVSRLLASYQQALVHILGQHEIPGISANEMESFCMRSRSSAYTCGLRSCPRATIGFDSAMLRDEHQIEHTRKYCCTYPTCQYPPFSSSRILKRHIRAKHTAAAPRNTIRQASPIKKKMDLSEFEIKTDKAAASANSATDHAAPEHFPGSSPPPILTQQQLKDLYDRFKQLKDNDTPPNDPEFIRIQQFLMKAQQQSQLRKQQQELLKKLEQHQQQQAAATNQMFPQGVPQGWSPAEQQQMMVENMQNMQTMPWQQRQQLIARMPVQMQGQMPRVVTQTPAPPAQAAQPPTDAQGYVSPTIEELTAQLDQYDEERGFRTPDIAAMPPTDAQGYVSPTIEELTAQLDQYDEERGFRTSDIAAMRAPIRQTHSSQSEQAQAQPQPPPWLN